MGKVVGVPIEVETFEKRGVGQSAGLLVFEKKFLGMKAIAKVKGWIVGLGGQIVKIRQKPEGINSQGNNKKREGFFGTGENEDKV